MKKQKPEVKVSTAREWDIATSREITAYINKTSKVSTIDSKRDEPPIAGK